MKRVLVIRFSALGDVAMLVPVVRALVAQYPDVEVTVLSQQRMADLFADMPKNVRFLGVDLKKQSLREIVASLGHFDLVADMHGVWRSLYIRINTGEEVYHLDFTEAEESVDVQPHSVKIITKS